MNSSNQSSGAAQDYIKIFLVSLITSIAVLFGLGPFMLDMQARRQGPLPQAEVAATTAGAAQAAEPAAGPAQITAPNLQGLALREARERWRAAGIVIIEDSQRIDPSADPGTILSQNPAGGAPLQSKEIRVVVSAAPEMVTVPSVVGKLSTAATEVLVDAGFEVPAPDREASSEIAGSVLRQEPNAGSKSEKGSLVRLVVAGSEGGEAEAAGGDAGDLIEVPRLTGIQLSAARKRITKAGLSVGQVRQREDPEIRGNTVLSQDPASGAKAEAGAAVDLVIVVPDD